MELREFSIERYKGYAEPTDVALAPLTILVGSNNSGKTVLAQAIQLLAGGLSPSGQELSEPLPLQSGGIQHGETFEDLVTGRIVHGWLRLSATLANDNSELSLAATVRNVVAANRPSERQIAHWSLKRDGAEIVAQREGFDPRSLYRISVSGTGQDARQIAWRGLIPSHPEDLSDWAAGQVEALSDWARGIRHLQCPRGLLASPFSRVEQSPMALGPKGHNAPLALAADDELRRSVRNWYRRTFGVRIDVVSQGRYFELVVGASARDTDVRLVQSGRGLSHALPVVVMALTARRSGPGVDIIEHPEAELHPVAHADIAEILLENLAGPDRPLVVETHSEMFLLRARRWVAEGRLPADHVLVYWIHTEPGRGSILRKIRMNQGGALDNWPEGVFIEDYEEILAIRRAARTAG